MGKREADMNARATATFESVGSILAAHKGELAKGFGVSEIGVFGSVASGTAKEESDVDILVSFSRPVGFISFMRLERRLQELLGRKVDLVTRKALRPYIGKRILSEVRFV
ncbi:MAG: nucleotidyltransferase family protein [Deltaproteobacteria bacterium]|nr:nucleotidyltransferase family protein [Deltaproteobacteria bacterium]